MRLPGDTRWLPFCIIAVAPTVSLYCVARIPAKAVPAVPAILGAAAASPCGGAIFLAGREQPFQTGAEPHSGPSACLDSDVSVV